MQSRCAVAVFLALLMAALVGCDRRPPPLTEARVIEQLDGKTTLELRFETGPETGQPTTTSTSATCTNMPPLDDMPRAAIGA